MHKSFLIYCIFGAMATLVNMLTYELLYSAIGCPNVISAALSWAAAVTFAFFTNRYIVFRHKGKRRFTIIKEIGFFYLARLSTGILDVLIMFIAVDVLALDHTLWKLIANLIAGIINYLAGKLFIFAAGSRNRV